MQRPGGLDVPGTPVQSALAQPGGHAHVLALVSGRWRPPRAAVSDGTAPPAPAEPATTSVAAAAPPPPATAASAAATATSCSTNYEPTAATSSTTTAATSIFIDC